MTREQAIHRAVEREALEGRGYFVVAERFRCHKPSYHVLDLSEWRHRKRLRNAAKGWTNWFEVWPFDEWAALEAMRAAETTA